MRSRKLPLGNSYNIRMVKTKTAQPTLRRELMEKPARGLFPSHTNLAHAMNTIQKERTKGIVVAIKLLS